MLNSQLLVCYMCELSLVIIATFVSTIPTEEVGYYSARTNQKHNTATPELFVHGGNLPLEIMSRVLSFRVLTDDTWKKKKKKTSRSWAMGFRHICGKPQGGNNHSSPHYYWSTSHNQTPHWDSLDRKRWIISHPPFLPPPLILSFLVSHSLLEV